MKKGSEEGRKEGRIRIEGRSRRRKYWIVALLVGTVGTGSG